MPGQECRCAPRTREFEEEKAFTGREIDFMGQLRNMRQVTSLECRHRILDEKSAGLLFPTLFLDEVECRLELKGPAARIVSVAGHEMDQSVGQPAPGILFRSWAKSSRQAACR